MTDLTGEGARLERLAHAVREMDGQTREVFLLHRLDRIDYPRIADRLGISIDQVERHLAEAILELERAAGASPDRADS